MLKNQASNDFIISDGIDRTSTSDVCYDDVATFTPRITGGAFLRLVLHFSSTSDVISFRLIRLALTTA